MLKIASLLAAFLISFPATAVVWDIRADDTGAVVEVDEITVRDSVRFPDLPSTDLFRESMGIFKWGSILKGQSVDCIDYPSGQRQGKILDGPSLPIDTSRTAFNGGNEYRIYNYENLSFSVYGPNYTQYTSSYYTRTSQAWNDGSSTLGCSGGNARDPWSVVFSEPATAVSVELSISCSLDANKRLHFEFWGTDGVKIGHRDIVESSDVACVMGATRLSFESSIPIAAISTWGEDTGPVLWLEVAVGDSVLPPPDPPPAPLTLEERVQHLESLHGIVR